MPRGPPCTLASRGFESGRGLVGDCGGVEEVAAEKDGELDSIEEKLELLEFATLVDDVALRDKPGIRVIGVDCFTGEGGCVETFFGDPVSSIK